MPGGTKRLGTGQHRLEVSNVLRARHSARPLTEIRADRGRECFLWDEHILPHVQPCQKTREQHGPRANVYLPYRATRNSSSRNARISSETIPERRLSPGHKFRPGCSPQDSHPEPPVADSVSLLCVPAAGSPAFSPRTEGFAPSLSITAHSNGHAADFSLSKSNWPGSLGGALVRWRTGTDTLGAQAAGQSRLQRERQNAGHATSTQPPDIPRERRRPRGQLEQRRAIVQTELHERVGHYAVQLAAGR